MLTACFLPFLRLLQLLSHLCYLRAQGGILPSEPFDNLVGRFRRLVLCLQSVKNGRGCALYGVISVIIQLLEYDNLVLALS